MAQVDPEHLAPLTAGWVTLLVASFILLGVLQHYADR
jgi:hypothetical protein